MLNDRTHHDSMPSNLEEFRDCEQQELSEAEQLDKLKALEARVPSVDDLKLIAIDPREWLSEPGWPD
jgi:hypothetical protein